jgi:hypothetical protein
MTLIGQEIAEILLSRLEAKVSTIATPSERIKTWQTIAIALAILEAIGLLFIWSKYQDHKKQVPYSPNEQVYVNRAIQAYAQKYHLPKEVVMKGRFPVVARTRDGLCVNIRGSTGGMGHVPIYCFEKNGKLVFHGMN